MSPWSTVRTQNKIHNRPHSTRLNCQGFPQRSEVPHSSKRLLGAFGSGLSGRQACPSFLLLLTIQHEPAEGVGKPWGRRASSVTLMGHAQNYQSLLTELSVGSCAFRQAHSSPGRAVRLTGAQKQRTSSSSVYLQAGVSFSPTDCTCTAESSGDQGALPTTAWCVSHVETAAGPGSLFTSQPGQTQGHLMMRP